MALIQQVENGKIVEDTTSTTNQVKKSGNDLGYDEFLKILCAEMQYQDPLEPTSNTEYIAQLATFSQLESQLSVQNTIEASQADNLVGKYVIMKVTSSTTGETTYPQGVVDYVLHQNGSIYLAVADGLYNLEDLDTVTTEEYMDAVTLSTAFTNSVATLPDAKKVTVEDKEDIEAIREVLDAMSDYQKSFLDLDVYRKFVDVEAAYKKLAAASETVTDTDSTDKTTGETESTDETDSGSTTES